MRKSLKWMNLALAGALTLSLAACGSSSKEDENKGTETGTETTPKAENVTITFQNIYPDPETPSYKIMKQIVDQYTKDHPNVKIELDSLNTDQQKLKLKTQAASKEVPDITIVNPAAQMKPFVDAGLLAPLNDMLEKDDLKGTFQEGILDFYSFDNNTYALPDGNNVAVVFYTKNCSSKLALKCLQRSTSCLQTLNCSKTKASRHSLSVKKIRGQARSCS